MTSPAVSVPAFSAADDYPNTFSGSGRRQPDGIAATDSITRYLREIGKVSLLSSQQEVHSSPTASKSECSRENVYKAIQTQC